MLIFLAQGILLMRFAMRNTALVLCHIILSRVWFRACYVRAGELDYLRVKWQKKLATGSNFPELLLFRRLGPWASRFGQDA